MYSLQGRSQMIMLSGSFLFLAGVFSFKKQCRTAILIDFVEIRRGRLTPTQPRSSAPDSLHPKIIAIIEFKIYPIKNANFHLTTIKNKIIFEIFLQKTINMSSIHHKK